VVALQKAHNRLNQRVALGEMSSKRESRMRTRDDEKEKDSERRSNMFCKRPRLRQRLKPARHSSSKAAPDRPRHSCTLSSPPPHDSAVSQDTRHLAPSMGSTFQARVDGHFVIPGTHTAAGGTTNFNFGPSRTNCTLEPHRQSVA
jgi:hypothetical protein